MLPKRTTSGASVAWLDYCDYRHHIKGLSGLAVHRQSAFTLGDGQPASLAWGELVSGNYFDVLGAYPVVVISARLWRNYFQSDPSIVGKTVRVNRRSLTIAGVTQPEFRGSSPVMQHDLWVPLTMAVALGSPPEGVFRDGGSRGYLSAICRIRPGAGMAGARAEVRALAASLAAAHPKTNRGVNATVLPTWAEHNGVNGYLRAPLAILLAVAFPVLLIVCANLANLLLARSMAGKGSSAFASRWARDGRGWPHRS